MRKIFRYEVPVDGEAHTFDLDGNPLHVEARGDDVVEFWAHRYDDRKSGITRAFQVFGTGHPVPDDARWFGTTARTPSGLVWHIFEVASDGNPRPYGHPPVGAA